MQLTADRPKNRRFRELLLVLVIGGLGACEPVVGLATDALKNPRDVALACVDGGKVVGLSVCAAKEGDSRLHAYVSAGSRGTIAVGKPHVPEWLDNDPAIPGFTPWAVDGLPQDVTITSADPTHLFTTLPVLQQVARIEVLTGKTDAIVQLPFSPGAMAVHAPTKRIFLADPAGGSVWWLSLDAFDSGGGAQEILVDNGGTTGPIGGSPNSLAWVSVTHDDDGDGTTNTSAHLFVGHLDHGHVTILSLADLKLIKRLPIDAQCADGVDNDGDGLTDRADSGCDDRSDTFEGDPERGDLCADNIDNDGDGRTDGVDLGCQGTVTHDTCRDGLDNDGDGLTDYPADPGCSGFASSGEGNDNPACSDGVDNDGDGQTDTDDSQCDSPTSDGERPPVNADVIAACGDGIDNDGDGLVDTDDSDCKDKHSGAESRPICADGIDNDGDGKTDTDDADCFNRAAPSEVSVALSPATTLAASHNGRFVAVGHRRRRQVLVLDTVTLQFLQPIAGATTPFERASTLGTRIMPSGVELGATPLSIAAVQHDGQDAFAVTLELRGMVLVRLQNASGARSIGVVKATNQAETASFKPVLRVAGKQVDMSNRVPERFASFGSLTRKVFDDPNKSAEFYGLTMTSNQAEHRTESWRFSYRALLPGGTRRTGRFVTSSRLEDPYTDFCRLGVVPGDLVLIHRGEGAKDCEGLTGDVVRYTVKEVGAEHLVLADDGVVDIPVTDDNQKTIDPNAAPKVPLPNLACVPTSGMRYDLRANSWLVRGSVSGIASSVPRDDGGCGGATLKLRTASSRLIQPELVQKNGTPIALPACPIRQDDTTDDLAESFGVRDYATGKLEAMRSFENNVFMGRFVPGCTAGADLSEPPRLLPSVREATWTYSLVTGFRPQVANVGVLAVSVVSDAALPHAYVIDQGTSSMRAVSLNDLGLQATLD